MNDDYQFDPDARITANFRNMPIPDFVNEALGEQLSLSYVLDPAVNRSEDLVTFSLTEPVTAKEFFQAIKVVLAEYGIAIAREGELLKVMVDKNASGERPHYLKC